METELKYRCTQCAFSCMSGKVLDIHHYKSHREPVLEVDDDEPVSYTRD